MGDKKESASCSGVMGVGVVVVCGVEVVCVWVCVCVVPSLPSLLHHHVCACVSFRVYSQRGECACARVFPHIVCECERVCFLPMWRQGCFSHRGEVREGFVFPLVCVFFLCVFVSPLLLVMCPIRCFVCSRADNNSDDTEKSISMVNDIIDELMDLDMEPKPESFWWTSTYKAEDGLTLALEVGSRRKSWETPFVEVFDLLGCRF